MLPPSRPARQPADPPGDLPEPSSRALRVLVVHPDEVWVRSLDTILAPHGYTVVGVPSGTQALQQIRLVRPDVLILHHERRSGAGIELCRALRQGAEVDPSTPILITTTGPCTREECLSALRAGAWECYGLPVDAEMLLLKLNVYAGAKLHAERALEANLLDPATGLYSPAGMLRRVRELGLAARRHGWTLGCVALSPAPAASDEAGETAEVWIGKASAVVAEALRSSARVSDAVGRLSPTEFAVVSPETDRAGGVDLARRLVETIQAQARQHPDLPDPLPIRVGCYAVEDLARSGLEPVELLVRATLAMRHAPPATDADQIDDAGEEPTLESDA